MDLFSPPPTLIPCPSLLLIFKCYNIDLSSPRDPNKSDECKLINLVAMRRD